MTQTKFSFDIVSRAKAFGGFLISALPAFIIFLFGLLSGYTFNDPAINSFVAWVIPVLTYSVYKLKDGLLTWKKFGWSVLLSGLTAGLIWVQGTSLGTTADALIVLIVPTLVNALKEYIRGENKPTEVLSNPIEE
jgi:hypothetical protein